MRLNFALLSKNGGTSGTQGTASNHAALSRPTDIKNRGDTVGQAYAPLAEKQAERAEVSHPGQNKVGRCKPSIHAVVPPVPLVPPKKHMNEIDREAFEERAAILEFDGGLSREEAEVCAWLDAIGERTPEIIAEVLAACRRDAEARAYFLGRAGLRAGERETLIYFRGK